MCTVRVLREVEAVRITISNGRRGEPYSRALDRVLAAGFWIRICRCYEAAFATI